MRVEEEDKVGVKVVVEGGLAVAAAMAGTPGLAAAAGFMPMIDYYLSQVRGRVDNVNALVEDTVEAVGATPEEFLEWIKADRRHLTLFHEAVEGAWSTFEQDRVEALKRVLADGYRDNARIDIDTLVVKALRDLDPPHVQVLHYLRYSAVTRDWLESSFWNLRGAIDPILSLLERHNCVVSADDKDKWADKGKAGLPGPATRMTTTDEWAITQFGLECLRFLNGVHPDDELGPIFE